MHEAEQEVSGYNAPTKSLGVALCSPEGKLICLDRQALVMLGDGTFKTAQRSLDAMLEPEKWQKAAAGHEVWSVRPSKNEGLVVGLLPLAGKDGGVECILCTIGEGKEQVDSFNAVRMNEERFRYISRMISDYAYSFAVKPDLTLVGEWVSESFTQRFGYTLEEIDERGGWAFMVHPDDLEIAVEHARRALSGESHVCEMRFLTRNGEARWLRDYVVPLFDPETKRLVRLYGVSRDITEERQAFEELERSRRFLEDVFSAIQDGISILDTSMNIIHTNETMRRWYRSSIPLEGKKCYEAYHGRGTPCEPCPVAQCLRHGKVAREIVNGPPGGEVQYLELFAYPHFDDSGKVNMVVEFVRDITDKRKLEAQLVQAQKMEAVARLAGGVAHDFNNLLSVIIGRADMLMNELDGDSPLRKDIREILDAGRRAERLTRQLLTFSRRQVMQPEIIDLNDVVRSLSDFIARVVGEDVNVEFFTDAQLGGIRADLSQIEQVLMNLVVNARDAMPEGGKLTIETANVELDEKYARSHADVAPGRYVMLAVSDTGIGMDERTQQKIFEPFFTTKEEGRGTGLGLATVYGIVRQCGGYIWVYSEPGKGTTFKIYFPAVDVSEKKRIVESRDVPRGSEVVLVVEDDDAVRRFLEKALQSLGYEPLIASGAEQALKLVRESASLPELLLTDVVLEDDDGRRLAERLCSEHPGLKVLFISGYTTNGIVHNGMLDEGINFLPKPFSLMTLARKMREVLDGE